jgi:gas vesicle protein
MNTSSKVFLGVLSGAAVGAILAVLYAPDKGSNTRRKIVEGANDMTASLAGKVNGYVDRLSKGMDEAKDEVGNLVENGKAKMDGAKQDINGQFDKTNGKVEDNKKYANSYK